VSGTWRADHGRMNETNEPEQFLYDVRDGVATLTLNRPGRYNALTHGMIGRWIESLGRAAQDDAVKVLLLTANGKAFCSGGDVGAQRDRAKQSALERKNYLWNHVHRIALEMERLEKPVVCAINGTARGAGMDMALMCDIRLMAASATMAESYIEVGLIAGDGGTYYLPRLIGTGRALELFWTGRVIDATEAERIGLVNRIVDDDRLQDEARTLARAIAARPAEAVRAYKRATYQGLEMRLPAHLDMVSSHMALLRETPEHLALIEAFEERRRQKTAAKQAASG
jgi:enoyl-CoA hydratase/carnithine racemase